MLFHVRSLLPKGQTHQLCPPACAPSVFPSCLCLALCPSCLCLALCISAQPIQTFGGRKSSVSLRGPRTGASAGHRKAAGLPHPSPLSALTPRSRLSLLTRCSLSLQENTSLGKIFAKFISNILGSTNYSAGFGVSRTSTLILEGHNRHMVILVRSS